MARIPEAIVSVLARISTRKLLVDGIEFESNAEAIPKLYPPTIPIRLLASHKSHHYPSNREAAPVFHSTPGGISGSLPLQISAITW